MNDQLPSSIRDIFDFIEKSLVLICERWDIVNSLYRSGSVRIRLLNQTAPGFFSSIQPILYYDVVLSICRTADPPKQGKYENASIEQLIEAIGKSSHHDEGLLQQLKDAAANLQRCCDDMRPIRNKRMAHSCLRVALDLTLQENLGVAPHTIEDAIKEIERILNLVRIHFGDGERRFLNHPELYRRNSDIFDALIRACEYQNLEQDSTEYVERFKQSELRHVIVRERID
ncbi:MAG: hypothetical protein KDA90_19650 [Planctomycetaceae bacterium]|nr:hypothetical protein [Planctomycetaceae bacterium]